MSALVNIELPWPARDLWPNRSIGRHWGARHVAADAAKLEAWTKARPWATVYPRDVALAVSIQAAPPSAGRFDLDNLLAALKPSLDGVAQGLEIDDAQFAEITLRKCEPVAGGAITVNVILLPSRRTGRGA